MAERKVTTANSFFGLYEPVVSPWVGSQGGMTGGTDTQFYLFGDPRDVAAFGLAFLDGNDRPIIETREQPADKLGLILRGYTDFGVCQIDNKGAVKSDGA